jgi:hypothetical protein
MSQTADYKPWNWCPHCKQPVDADDVFDGTEVRCVGCDRIYMCCAATGLDGSHSWWLEETHRSRKTTQHRRRT